MKRKIAYVKPGRNNFIDKICPCTIRSEFSQSTKIRIGSKKFKKKPQANLRF